ncbi:MULTISPECIES: hypothetical protein [Rhodococcus]|uniref:hypothetical protein n=1 Tax=Rhodococcus TaxID=1827 RepID=UPI0009E61D25|nr:MULTISPECIES: hypothetical protein [Rhodococcus]MDO2381358.1 hypothetical protein [Rhodococcus ruber]MBP2213409.1 hypothetical protein [Rhodococcus ruber]MCF8785559.1 hypothetical protein [Rhodococcus ruber]MDO1478806.1 hypothetical protein [Rhodococcus ruber]UIR35300.1 hypothetical protein LZP97_16770 [Rhodococcus sp. DMF-1]
MVGDAGAAHARWRQIVEDIGRFDAGAGRQAQCALERHDAPLRVQIAGRGGAVRPTLRTAVESAVATVAHVEAAHVEAAHVEAAHVEAAELDSPDRPEPVLDADVVLLVLAARAHPADLAALARSADPAAPVPGRDERLVVVLDRTEGLDDADAAFARAAAQVRRPVLAPGSAPAAVADRLGSARRRRAAALARDLAGIAAGPRARDVIEAALDDLLGTA